MNQYLVSQGYWGYIKGSHDKKPNITNTNYPKWEQGAIRVMYCLETCVHDHMLGHIWDAKAPKVAWKNLLHKRLLVMPVFLPKAVAERHLYYASLIALLSDMPQI